MRLYFALCALCVYIPHLLRYACLYMLLYISYYTAGVVTAFIRYSHKARARLCGEARRVVDKVRAVRGLCAPSVMVARLRSGCERERGRAEARRGEGSIRCAVRRQAGTERARTSGGDGARGFPSVRVARGCAHPYKMRGGEMAVLPSPSVRNKNLTS